MKIEAIDLFCGVGGLTYGLNQAGIEVLAGLDNDKSCIYSYEKNNDSRFILADIAKYDFHQMLSLFSKESVKVLVGCAPCQPFSAHAHKRKNRNSDDRWNLITHFLKAVRILKPDIISMENVTGLTRTRVFKKFVRDLQKLEYLVDSKVVYCPNYGIPQGRSRLVLLASRLGEIRIPKKTHTVGSYITVGQTIRDLPKIKAGGVSKKDKTHTSRNLSPLNLARIRQSSPRRTWRDWNKELLPKCYTKKSGNSYSAVYGRMSWDKVSPTITTQFFSYGTGRFGHPEQDRAISIREGALLQTFPRSYKFDHATSLTAIGRHIGNAVPPKLGRVIGNAIKTHVRECHEKGK